ncbi:MAG: ABC transporter permease [Evtepia sp.]
MNHLIWRKFKRDRRAMAGLIFLIVEILIVLILPMFLQISPTMTDQVAGFWSPPSSEHWLGTDDVGRDIFARLLHGGRISLMIGFAAAFMSLAIGIPLGLIAGYRRGAVEFCIMRCVDVVQSFPSMILILCLVSLVGPSAWNIILVIGGLGWASVTRLVYGNTLSIREKDYILAVRALGASNSEILRKNIFPNAVAPVLSILPMKVGRAILSESGLSFLGVGLRTPEASWGNMMQNATELMTLTHRPWMWLPPGLCIIATIFALQFVGEGLRKAMNPKEMQMSEVPRN